MSSIQKIEYITEFNFCDRNHFLILKGISILMVLAEYFCRCYLNFPYLEPLQGVGSAVFLLCSGYGVSESFNIKGGLPHYWENKAIKIWIPSVVVTLAISWIFTGNIVHWVGNNPLALQGWFLYLLFGEYLAFWLAFHFLEKKSPRMISLFAVSALLFFLLGEDYEAVAVQMFCFPLGVLFSQMSWKYPVRELSTLKKVLLCAVLAILAAGMYFLYSRISGPMLMRACRTVFCLSAAALLFAGVYYAQKIGIFGLFAPVGTISYALYLLYGPVLSLLNGRMEQWRVIAAVFVILFVAAGIYSWLCRLFVNYNKKLRRRKSTHLKGSMW